MALWLFILVIAGAHQVAAAFQGSSTEDLIVEYGLRQLLSSDFLNHFHQVLNHEQEVSNNPLSDEYAQTIWEMRQIAENISFQAFLNRLNILKAAVAAQKSESDIHYVLSNERSALSKYRARLNGTLSKLRAKSDLVIYQHDTIQRELDHIIATRNKLETYKAERKSRLALVVSLKNQIRYCESLIAYQEDFLAKYHNNDHLDVETEPPRLMPDGLGTPQLATEVHSDEMSLSLPPEFSGETLEKYLSEMFKSWKTESDQVSVQNESDDNKDSRNDGQETRSVTELEDSASLSYSQRMDVERARRRSRSQSISSELSSIYKLAIPQKSSKQEPEPRKAKGSRFLRWKSTAEDKVNTEDSNKNQPIEKISRKKVGGSRSTDKLLQVPRLLEGQIVSDLKPDSFSEFIKVAELPKKNFSWKLARSWFKRKSSSSL